MLSLYELKKILNPKQDSTPEDDFRIIQSWAEYDEKSSKPPEERNLKYLCYELEVMNPDTGEITHFYKAIKFARVIRLPANSLLRSWICRNRFLPVYMSGIIT